jgi:exonuclease VII small subunit
LKLEVFETQMEHLREIIDEKDNVIVDLERKIECFKKSKVEEYEEIKKQNIELENSIKELQINIMKSNEKLSDLEDNPMENCDKSNLFNDSNLDETIENLETSVRELKKVTMTRKNI